MEFWSNQPFDLGLRQHEGNCDLCFLKSTGKILAIMKDRPELADWWIEREQEGGQVFRRDRHNYSALLKTSKIASLPMFDEPDELGIACHCTD